MKSLRGTGAEAQVGERISNVEVLPAGPDVGSDIEAGPTERRRHNWRGRGARLGIQVSSGRCVSQRNKGYGT